jgi:hypothetical protein
MMDVDGAREGFVEGVVLNVPAAPDDGKPITE